MTLLDQLRERSGGTRWAPLWGVVLLALVDNALFSHPYKSFAGFLILEAVWTEKLALVLVFVAFLALAYGWLSFAQSLSTAGRAAAVSCFLLAGLHEYGYRETLGRYSTSDDIALTLFFSNAAHWVDAAEKYASPKSGVPSLILIVWLRFAARPEKPFGRPVVLTATTVFLCAVAGVAGHLWSKRFSSFPAPAPLTLTRSVVDFSLEQILWPTADREKLKWLATIPPKNNIVLVVAESMSGDALSLNGYGRPTTPVLEELEGKGYLRNWGIASSGSTCSQATGFLLVSGLRSDLVPDTQMRAQSWPSIFQYAKAAGYKTSFLDGQMDSFWIGIKDRPYVDVWVPYRDIADRQRPWETDARLARKIRSIIDSGPGHFVMVWLAGVHTPYVYRFPPEKAVWTPTQDSWDYKWSQDPNQAQLIRNAYDNAVRFEVESFFSAYLDQDGSPPESTVMVYTGDHGQTLARNGETHTHCGGTRNESLVPLFAVARNPLSPGKPRSVPAAHENIFATLLDLMAVPGSARAQEYAASLLDPGRSGRPRVTYGGMSLRSPDHRIVIDQ